MQFPHYTRRRRVRLKPELLISSHDPTVPNQGKPVPPALGRLVKETNPSANSLTVDFPFKREYRGRINVVLRRRYSRTIYAQVKDPVEQKMAKRPTEVMKERLVKGRIN